MAKEVETEDIQPTQQEEAGSDESELQVGEESSNDSSQKDKTQEEDEDPGKDTGVPTDESDAADEDGEQTEQDSDNASLAANSRMSRALPSTAYLTADIAIDINDSGVNNQGSGGQTVVYTATVNKAADSLSNYTLTPNFTGNGTTVTKVEVYVVESGVERLLTVGDDYILNGNEVVLTDLSNACLVKYYVELDTPFSSLPTAEADFASEYTLSDGTQDTATDTVKLSQLDVSSLQNSTIITDINIIEAVYDQDTDSTTVEAAIYWQLYNLIGADESTISLSNYQAGSYFVFQLDDKIEIHNNTAGNLTLQDLPDIVGSYYITMDGYVIIVLGSYVDDHESINGKVEIKSTVDGEVKSSEDLNITINNETPSTVPIEPEYGLTKGVASQNGDEIVWGINVNTQGETLKNLTMTDMQQGSNTSSNSKWVFTGDIKVYKGSDANGTLLVEGVDYTAEMVNGTCTIQLGDVDEEYYIELGAKDDTTTTFSSSTYKNTVTASADGYKDLSANTTATKKLSTISKSGIMSTSSDGNTGTASWNITYGTNGEDIAVTDLKLTDTLSKAQWVGASGYIDFVGVDDSDNTTWANLIKDLQIIYTPANGSGAITLQADDYDVSVVSYNATNNSYEIIITLKEGGTNFASGSSINGTLEIKYNTESNLTTKPSAASGWKISNSVLTQDNTSASNTPTVNFLTKAASAKDYDAETITWKITVYGGNQSLKDGDVIYDVLPDGLTVVEGSIKVNVVNGGSVEVIETGGSPSGTEYFEADYNPSSISTPSITPSFSLTYHNTGGDGTGTYEITFTTKYNYDPNKTGANGNSNDGYIDNTSVKNQSYWVFDSGNNYYNADATTSVSSTLASANGKKSGDISYNVDSDGTITGATITWTTYANFMNLDISGKIFTDELKIGLDGEGGSPVSGSEQTISASDITNDITSSVVKVHTYKMTGSSSYQLDQTDNKLHKYLVDNGYLTFDTATNTVKIEFPPDFADEFETGGALDGLSSMRFCVVITANVNGTIASYYPNTAVQQTENKDYEWSADVTAKVVNNSATKSGSITSTNENAIVDFTVVLNKAQQTIENMKITDSLMYYEVEQDKWDQILYLKSDDAAPYGCELRIYKAKIKMDESGNPVTDANGDYVYEKVGDALTAADYTLTYITQDESGNSVHDGFTVEMKNDVTTALIMEYVCVVDRDAVAKYNIQKLTNTVEVNGKIYDESKWESAYKYTTSSGAYSGENVSFAIKKVDSEGEPVLGATFSLWDVNRLYIRRSGEVDNNGIVEFKDVTTGTYYLVEDAPEGYETSIGSLADAKRVVIKSDADGKVTVTLGMGDDAIAVYSGDESLAILEIENTKITGGFTLTKYIETASGVETNNPLENAKFVLYRIKETDVEGETTKWYYTGKDLNGVALFETDVLEEAAVLKTDSDGIISLDGIPGGTYYLKETEAPEGYHTIDDPVEIIIPRGEIEPLTFYDKEKTGSFKLTKYIETASGTKTTDPLENAKFVLYQFKDTDTEGETTQRKWYYTGKDESGVALFETDVMEEATVLKTDSDGIISLDGIPEGTYYLEEIEAPIGYLVIDPVEISILKGDINTLTRYDKVETINTTVEKVWDDVDDQDDIRPANVEVQLYADGAKYGDTVTLDESNYWSYTWGGLQKYDSGNLIKYTVEEVKVPDDYEVSYSEDTFTITNIHIPKTTERTVEKQWDDSDNQDGCRPDSIKVQLKANGSNYGEEVTLSEENNWSYKWSDLPKYAKEEIFYSVVEVETPETSEYAVYYSEEEGVFTITNRYTPEEVSKTVSKNWDDDNNKDGIRAAKIKVQLYADDAKYGDAVVLDASNNWVYTWNNLPKYDSGQEIEYTVKETAVPDDYDESYSDDTFTITNTHTPSVTERTVTKEWDDKDDQDGIRPDSIKVQLYADGEKNGDVVTLDASNTWTYTWKNLPEYKAGEAIMYTVKEIEVPDDYEVNYSEDTFTITNTHTPPVTERTVTKRWDDKDDQDVIRPDSIKVQLYADGEKYGDAVTLDSSNNWSHTWNNLPEYKLGEIIQYTVEEVEVPDGYEVSYSEDTFTITNTHIPEITERTVIKQWDDSDNQDGNRPDSITVQLKGNGSNYGEEITLSDENNWSHTWSDLPKFENKEEITYSIVEVETPSEYAVDYSEEKGTFTITNSYTPGEVSKTVSKNWDDSSNQDGIRTEQIKVQLYADGEKYGEAITLDASNNWSYKWNNLPEYNSEKAIKYTVEEVEVPDGYEVSYSEDTFTITNSHTPAVTERTATKKWDDKDNKDSIRPDSINVQLYADGEKYGDAVTLAVSNKWTYTWSNLPEYKAGEAIKYTVKEIEVPDGYKVSYSKDTFTITNTHTPGKKATTSTKTTSGTKTGDESNMILWLLLIAASAAGIIAIVYVKKRKRK